MNRSDLQQLANDRAFDAAVLLDGDRWSGAYYLAGYSVESALKACIAKRTSVYDFPDKNLALRAFTHNLAELLDIAELKLLFKLDSEPSVNPKLDDHWKRVIQWTEQARYQQKTEKQARELFDAVTDPVDGVLPWIRGHW